MAKHVSYNICTSQIFAQSLSPTQVSDVCQEFNNTTEYAYTKLHFANIYSLDKKYLVQTMCVNLLYKDN